jgi:hypothetical protein
LSLETRLIDLVAGSYESYKKAVALRQILAGTQKELEKKSADAAVTALKEFDQKAVAFAGLGWRGRISAVAAEAGAGEGRRRRLRR